MPATSGPPQLAPGGRAYLTHRTHGRKISCIRLYLSLGAVRGRAAPRCDPLRLSPRLGRICVSDTFCFYLSLSPKNIYHTACHSLEVAGVPPSRRVRGSCCLLTGGFFLSLSIFFFSEKWQSPDFFPARLGYRGPWLAWCLSLLVGPHLASRRPVSPSRVTSGRSDTISLSSMLRADIGFSCPTSNFCKMTESPKMHCSGHRALKGSRLPAARRAT